MLQAYQFVQLAFAVFMVLVIAGRVRVLCLRAATSEAAYRWLTRTLEAGDVERARVWARARPEAFVARMIAAADDEERRDLSFELRDRASAHLRLLRVSATLASTLGLLGGILALARADTGLSALRAGGAQREALTEAIITMAIGVATSALCFQALALLRPAARKLLEQTRQIARLLASPG